MGRGRPPRGGGGDRDGEGSRTEEGEAPAAAAWEEEAGSLDRRGVRGRGRRDAVPGGCGRPRCGLRGGPGRGTPILPGRGGGRTTVARRRTPRDAGERRGGAAGGGGASRGRRGTGGGPGGTRPGEG